MSESVNRTQEQKNKGKADSVALKHKVTKPDTGPNVVLVQRRRDTFVKKFEMEPYCVNNPGITSQTGVGLKELVKGI